MSHPGRHAEARPDAPALIRAQDGAVLSWSALHQRAVSAANRLHDLGLRPGSAVAFCLENRFEFSVFVWASHYAGFRYTPISTRFGPEEVAFIVNDCEAEALVVSETTREKALGGPLSLDRARILDIDAEPIDARAAAPRYARAEGVAMLYSSGTTGQPKGVWRPPPPEPIESTRPADAAIGGLFGIEPDSIYLSTAPLYHSAPLSFLLRMGRLGAATLVMDRFDAEEALRLIARHGVTHSQWVPTMFVRLLRLSEETKRAYDLRSHRFAIHGAAPCPVGVKEAMLDWWGEIVHEYYAGTEGAGTCLIGPQAWRAHKGSVGRPVGGKLHILGPEGGPLPTGEVGEVWFEGAASFAYYKDEAKTREARTAGRSTFGDLGYVDEDGFLYLTDRKAFTINVGGVNVYPQEAEDVLITHPKVLDAAVFGIPHEEYGEEVKGVVQLAPEVSASEAVASELVAHCRSRLATVKCPRSIDFVRELPRHPNGKLYKRTLRERYVRAGR